MFSLRNRLPLAATPVVVYGLISLNVAIYLYETSLDSAALQQFLDLWAMVPRQLTLEIAGARLTAAYEWPTLLTFQFLHVGWVHLVGNLFCLWIFGHRVEAAWGHAAFLLFYLICGGLSGLSQWMVEPFSSLPTLGASGAIAGVMGAYIVRFPQARIALFFVGFWFSQQVLYGALSLRGASFGDVSLGDSVEMMPVNVAYAAHAGGFMVGAAFTALAGFMANSRKHYLR